MPVICAVAERRGGPCARRVANSPTDQGGAPPAVSTQPRSACTAKGLCVLLLLLRLPRRRRILQLNGTRDLIRMLKSTGSDAVREATLNALLNLCTENSNQVGRESVVAGGAGAN